MHSRARSSQVRRPSRRHLVGAVFYYLISGRVRDPKNSAMGHDLLSLYVQFGIDPSARIAYSNDGYGQLGQEGRRDAPRVRQIFKK